MTEAEFIDSSVAMYLGDNTGPIRQSEEALRHALRVSSGGAVAKLRGQRALLRLGEDGALVPFAPRTLKGHPKTTEALAQIEACKPTFSYVIDMQDRRVRQVAPPEQPNFPIFSFNRLKSERQRLLWPLPGYYDLEDPQFLTCVSPDAIAWEDKDTSVVWRGITGGRAAGLNGIRTEGMRLKAAIRAFRTGGLAEERLREIVEALPRYNALKTVAHDPRFDFGFVDGDGYRIAETPFHAAFERPRIPQTEMQRAKYIAVLRGLDVGSSFYWVMNSGSVGMVMETPFETFASEHFQPWSHFIPFAQDSSDLVEKLDWAEAHQDECKAMVERAREVCAYLSRADLRAQVHSQVIAHLNAADQVP